MLSMQPHGFLVSPHLVDIVEVILPIETNVHDHRCKVVGTVKKEKNTESSALISS